MAAPSTSLTASAASLFKRSPQLVTASLFADAQVRAALGCRADGLWPVARCLWVVAPGWSWWPPDTMVAGHAQVTMDAIEALAGFAVASRVEDNLGLVQNTLPVVVSSLVACLIAVEEFATSPCFNGGFAGAAAAAEGHSVVRPQPSALKFGAWLWLCSCAQWLRAHARVVGWLQCCDGRCTALCMPSVSTTWRLRSLWRPVLQPASLHSATSTSSASVCVRVCGW